METWKCTVCGYIHEGPHRGFHLPPLQAARPKICEGRAGTPGIMDPMLERRPKRTWKPPLPANPKLVTNIPISPPEPRRTVSNRLAIRN